MSKKRQAKKQEAQKRRLWGTSMLACLLGLAACGIIVAGINYHGVTYDEPIYAGFGARAARWTLDLIPAMFNGTFLQHLSATEINQSWFATIDMQPPMVQVLSGLSSILFGGFLGGMVAPRFPTALFFGLAVGLVFWLTDKVFDRKAAFFAAIGLIFLPRFSGDAHLTTLDVPVSALILATAAAFFAASQRNSWKLAIMSGILLGLALLTKLNAGFLVIILAIWLIVFNRKMLPKAAAAFLVIAPIIFFLGWPWLWHDTFGHLREYLSFHMQHYPVNVYYLGQLYQYAPWHYPFVMLAITTPAILLLLMLLGIGDGARRRPAEAGRWLLIFGAVGFLLPSAMPFAPKYNGVRLFLPAFPFLMSLAGGGFSLLHKALVQWLEKARLLPGLTRPQMRLAILMGTILMLPAALELTKVFPCEQAYYNTLVGGPLGAQRAGFETIYWGGVYGSALKDFNAFPQASPRVLITPQGVVSLLETYQRSGGLRQDIKWSTPPPPQEQKQGWPQRALAGVDWVVFQCAQSEFDELAWKLYREGKPAPSSIFLGNTPLLLFYKGEEARRVFAASGERP
jgi:4-amino-4-deoxy-L-arabinose transferase-like glycosyltransferase